ncbi:hypothetical protein D3C78_1629820 [compost metagenome]
MTTYFFHAVAFIAQFPLDAQTLPGRRDGLTPWHFSAERREFSTELFTMAGEKVLLHGVEEAFFREVVINELFRFPNRLVAHCE